jgi:hypothetical protein
MAQDLVLQAMGSSEGSSLPISLAGVDRAGAGSRLTPWRKRWRLPRRNQVTSIRIKESMKVLGLQLIHGDYLARSVRGIPCAPPVDR